MLDAGSWMLDAGSWILDTGNRLHTACFTQFVKVHYFCHPLFDHEVQVLNRQTRGGEVYYGVALFDNSHVLLPAWMTDELACGRCVAQISPVCSLAALRRLRQILDSLRS
jgi:hypothetical protein